MAKPDAIKPVRRSKHINMLLYSIPGGGKTRLAGSKGRGTLILRPPVDHTDSILTDGVDEWVLKDWAEAEEAMDAIRFGELIQKEGYDWLWLDSISLFQDIGLDDLWQAATDRKPSRKEFDVDKGEYGINMNRLSRWIRHVVGADVVNFGITAHPFHTEDINGDPLLMPWVQGKNMPEKMCGYMNVVAYLEVKRKNDGKTVRVLHTDGDENFYAKCQFEGAFDKGRMLSPTLPKVEAAIEKVRPKPGRKSNTTRRRRAARRAG